MCPSLVPLGNGSISYFPDSRGTVFTIGTMAIYSCSAGFAQVGGDSIRSCMDDDQADTKGVWNGTAPTCQGELHVFVDFLINAFIMHLYAAIECHPLDTLRNGGILYSIDTLANYMLGTVATYSCNTRFALQGEPSRTCTADDQSDTVGVWSGSTPFCERKFDTFLTASLTHSLCSSVQQFYVQCWIHSQMETSVTLSSTTQSLKLEQLLNILALLALLWLEVL